jgi:hypothetical protein
MARMKAEAELEEVRKVAEAATRELKALRAKLGASDRTDADGTADGAADAAPPDEPGDGSRPFERIGGHTGPDNPDKRRSPRRAFRYRQLIAPMRDGCLPSRNHFVEVECRDISAGGIALVLSEPPDFEDLVVALGKPPDESHFTSKVVRVEELEERGGTRYLVGCRFTGRVYM